jgi:radical SAM superfamily enzyme YgiQ (UPF0313 family)
MKFDFINIYKPRNDRHGSLNSLAQLRLAASALSAKPETLIILDCFSYNENALSISNKILSKYPDYICFSVLKWNEDFIIKIILDLSKQNYLGKILVGGANAKELEKKIDPTSNLYIIIGEGEYFIYNLVNNNGLSLKHLSYNYTFSSQLYTLNKIIPIYSEFFLQSISAYNNIDTKVLLWETSRGCNFHCGYCGHRLRNESFLLPKYYIENELLYISKINPDNLFIVDPIMGGNKKNLLFILDKLSSLNSNIAITGYMHPHYLDNEVISSLSTSNISELLIGIQTLNPNVPKWVRKNDINKIRSYLPNLFQQRIPWRAELIVGLPGDDMIGLKETLQIVIEQLKPTWLRIYPLLLIKDSLLYSYYIENKSKIGFDSNGIISFLDGITTNDLFEMRAYAGAISSLFCFYQEKGKPCYSLSEIEAKCTNILESLYNKRIFATLDKSEMKELWSNLI